MSYKDKECLGCVGTRHDCIMPLTLKFGKKIFCCPCTNCMVRVVCTESCDPYKKYLRLSKKELNRTESKKLVYLETSILNNCDGYRDFLSHFKYFYKEDD